MIILLLGMPVLISVSMISNTVVADFFIPSMSVSISRLSRDSMSNQAGMRKPMFKEMGITGAVGHIT